MDSKVIGFKELVQDLKNKQVDRVPVTRFEIFKGIKMPDGRIAKARSMGQAYVQEGMSTYVVKLKSLLKDQFYLLPDKKNLDGSDFVILTREDAQNSNRKYFWNKVGIANLLSGSNHGLMRLEFDLFAGDIYMNTLPKDSNDTRADFRAA